jgi:hypothetical protein
MPILLYRVLVSFGGQDDIVGLLNKQLVIDKKDILEENPI